jgi:hypothetical protein
LVGNVCDQFSEVVDASGERVEERLKIAPPDDHMDFFARRLQREQLLLRDTFELGDDFDKQGVQRPVDLKVAALLIVIVVGLKQPAHVQEFGLSMD